MAQDSLYSTGVRPVIDNHLLEESKKVRDYGDYWSASSAGYCMRKVIFDRMKVPHVKDDPRKQRVFSSGHIFHEWIQKLTCDAGISVAQEIELQDEDLMVRGHFDDLVLINDNLILIDYKTAHSQSFKYKVGKPMGHFHRMQLGTYLYMLRSKDFVFDNPKERFEIPKNTISEARICLISKDDLRMAEQQLLWTASLEKDVYSYWSTLNGYWKAQTIPKCTCLDIEGGWLGSEKYNDYFYKGEPCSLDWYRESKEKGLLNGDVH
jgi:hypothetical protein